MGGDLFGIVLWGVEGIHGHEEGVDGAEAALGGGLGAGFAEFAGLGAAGFGGSAAGEYVGDGEEGVGIGGGDEAAGAHDIAPFDDLLHAAGEVGSAGAIEGGLLLGGQFHVEHHIRERGV